jgi:mercuric ion transport protein
LSSKEKRSSFLIGGGIVASFLASLCCIGPLILTFLGVSGAAVLSKVEAIRWPMILVVLALFSLAGMELYRKRNSCDPGSLCADPKKWKVLVVFYWVGLITAILAITSPYWVGWIFN